MAEVMLTTVDNPHDPFTDWRGWLTWDETRGYHSSGLLARITITSHELSQAEQDQAVEDAIDEIVSENVSGMHRKVTRESIREILNP